MELSYLAPYKLCQDHLEIWFNAVRICNGWSYNPTCRQFRSAYRSLLIHASKIIVAKSTANCTAHDETDVLNVSYNASTLNYVMSTVE
uniref:THAP domaincontaining protein 9like [Acyrthosiphon pisum] n=1 Tax=Lepeophtheirus salmonis TaxID=72036 RepID=A0A0K2UAZ6_LEPSM